MFRKNKTLIQWAMGMALLASALSAQPMTSALTTPAGAELTDGNVDLLWPLVSPGPVRFQQWFHNGLFPQGRLKITGISFRPDPVMGGRIDIENPSLLIRFATTMNNSNAVGQRFADNLGPDLTTVKSGGARVSSSFVPAANGTMAFDVQIVFDTPFVFDSTSGRHLMMDMFNEFGSNSATVPATCLLAPADGPRGCNMDAQSFPAGDSAMLRRWRSNAGTGTLAETAVAEVSDTRGFIVRFDYELMTADPPAPLSSAQRSRIAPTLP